MCPDPPSTNFGMSLTRVTRAHAKVPPNTNFYVPLTHANVNVHQPQICNAETGKIHDPVMNLGAPSTNLLNAEIRDTH